MSEITQLQLEYNFNIEPAQLLVANIKVPLERDQIPLRIFNRPFDMVRPTLTHIGEGIVSMALKNPFGFKRGIDDTPYVIESQVTDGIVISPDSEDEQQWLATLTTAAPLTDLDVRLFTWGIQFYAEHADARLHARRASIALPPIPSEHLITE